MANKKFIRIKALILLIVFSSNTLIGFSCALGIGRIFSDSHLDDHGCCDKITPENSHHHSKIKTVHQHNESDALHKTENKKDNCCNEKVSRLSTAEKLLPAGSYSVLNNSPITFSPTLYSESQLIYNDHRPRYYFITHHPPIPDIRIAIQSFQI